MKLINQKWKKTWAEMRAASVGIALAAGLSGCAYNTQNFRGMTFTTTSGTVMDTNVGKTDAWFGNTAYCIVGNIENVVKDNGEPVRDDQGNIKKVARCDDVRFAVGEVRGFLDVLTNMASGAGSLTYGIAALKTAIQTVTSSSSSASSEQLIENADGSITAVRRYNDQLQIVNIEAREGSKVNARLDQLGL